MRDDTRSDPSEPPGQETPQEAHEHHAPSAPRRAIGAALAVVSLVAVFSALLWSRGAGDLFSRATATPSATALPALNVQWQDYRDPGSLFTLRIPTTWQARRETGQTTYGDSSGGDTVTTESVGFLDPSLGAASPAVAVFVTPIGPHAASEYCQQAASGLIHSQPFHGLAMTARTDMYPVFLFGSGSASFQVDYWIPGVAEPPHSSLPQTSPPPTPTPLPAAWVAQDRQLLGAILASFQPIGPLTIPCP
jgi:hypothetical protein